MKILFFALISTVLTLFSSNSCGTTLNIDFGSIPTPQNGWNNINSFVDNTQTPRLVDSTGTATAITYESPNGFAGITSGGETDTIYPESASRDAFYISSRNSALIKFTNLYPDNTYNFTFFGSRSAAPPRQTVFTIGTHSVTLDAAYNTSNVAEITYIKPDPTGTISISITTAPGSDFGYLGILQIEGDFPPPIVKHWYVATYGDDNNSGTIDSPFRTIQKALNVVKPGEIVTIRQGIYREPASLPTSGLYNATITITNYQNEKVILSGCTPLTNWTPVNDHIWKTPCTWNAGSHGEGNTLFVNGKLSYEARQFAENNYMDIHDWGKITRGNLTQTYLKSNDIKGFGDDYWNGGTVHYHTTDWSFNDSLIADYDSDQGIITFAEPIGFISQKHDFGFYITHPDWRKTLDKPGEWYKDNNTNELYFCTEPGQNPASLEIEFRQHGYALDVRGCDFVTISNLEFRGCSIRTDSDTDHNIYQNCRFYAHDRDYEGRLYITGNHNVFRDNEVSHTWANGISLNGDHNSIINNYFHDIDHGNGRVISLSGSNHFICRNTARNFARGFIGNFPQQCEISYNLIENGGRLSWDTGDFDADVGQGTGGNCIVHHNVMRCPDALGNYHAFYSGSNLTFHHNIIYDWDPRYYLVHGSRKAFIKYIHNTFIGKSPNLSSHQDIRSKIAGANYTNNLQITADNIATIGVNCRGNVNYQESDFVNFSQDDFRLSANSRAIDAGILLPGINDDFQGESPDAGALEYGEPMWQVGHDFDNPPSPKRTWTNLPGTNLFANGQFLTPPSGWTYIRSPQWFFGNSWNAHGSGLASQGLYSMQFNPGDGMKRIFSDLKPDTWYTVGCEIRLTDERIYAEKFDHSSGLITTDSHRNHNYITDLTDGSWVAYDNIDFGPTGKYNQIELNFTRKPGTPYTEDPASFDIRLDSLDGQLLGNIDITWAAVDAWEVNQTLIPQISGKHTVFLVAKGSGMPVVMLATVRLQNTNIAAVDKMTIGVRNYGGTTISRQTGYALWQHEYDTFTFKTGPNSTSCELFMQNNGIYDAYLDQLALYEQPPISYDPTDLVKSDGIVTQENDFWQVMFVQAINIGRIRIYNVNDSRYQQLSRFKLSLWDNDPAAGGRLLWTKDYFETGSVKQGGTFTLTGNEIGADGYTRIASVRPKVIRIENNGTNSSGNQNLSLQDVSIHNLTDIPASHNAAAQGKAEISSYYYVREGHADDAINNIIDQWDSTSTQFFEHSWWQVDLMESTVIDQIVLFNSSNAGYRIGSFRVSVWNGNPQAGGQELWGRNYSYPTDITVGGRLTINGSVTVNGKRLDSLSNARFVRVQLRQNNSLGITEVQVWKKISSQKSPDTNGDQFVNLNDFRQLSSNWQNWGYLDSDFDYNGTADLSDLSSMIQKWLCPVKGQTLIAFEDFDGHSVGFADGSSWAGYTIPGSLWNGEFESGLGHFAQCISSGKPIRKLAAPVDLTGDGIFYVAGLFKCTGYGYYSVIKFDNSNELGLEFLWQSGRTWAIHHPDGWLNDRNKEPFQLNTTYLGVMKITASSTGNDTVSAVMIDVTHNQIPISEPVWHDSGVVNLPSYADRIILEGNTPIHTSYDNIIVTTRWLDIVEMATIN